MAASQLRIECPAAGLEQICADAVEVLSRFRHGGVEIGGVLYGIRGDDAVRIVDFRPLECEYAFGPRFTLSERDRSSLRAMLAAPRRDPKLRGLEVVGWYHSHTRDGIALSPRDVELCERFFPEPWQIALVIDPAPHGPCVAGVFAREGGRYALQYEVEVHPKKRPAALAPPVPESPPVAAAPEPQPEEPPAAAVDHLPSWADAEPPRSRKWLWATAVAVVLAAAAVAIAWYWTSGAPKPLLSLWVADVGGQLLIEWDRTARPVRNAAAGIIEIRDGGERVAIQMDPERLREGSVDYVRRSEIVDVKLRVRDAGGRTAEEMLRFVGPPVSRPLDELTRERDALKAEVERLRSELEKVRGGRIGPNASRRTP